MSVKDRINSMLIKLNLAATLVAPMKASTPNVPHSADFEPQKPTTETQIKQIPENSDLENSISLKDAMQQNAAQAKLQKEQQQKDSLDRAVKSNIRQTGYDIRYNSEDDTYGIETANSSFMLFQDELDYNKIAEIYLAEQAERFSKPTEYISDSISINDVLQEGGCAVAEYSFAENCITTHHITMQDKDKAIELVMSKTNRTEQEADSLVNLMYQELTDSDFIESVRDHEESHKDDFEKNLFIPNIPSKYLARLHCLTEIKATMTQAGRALEQYNKDGKLSHFAAVNCEVDTAFLQKELADHTFNEPQKQHTGRYIFDKWLETYNIENTPYSEHIAIITANSYETIESSFVSAHIEDTKEAHQEYLRRVDEMFKDVKYLGDMRGVINPDFELNPQLAKDSNYFIDSGFAPLTKNSETNDEAYGRIAGLLAVVRDCDMDGVRTPQEQKLINKTINELHQKAQNGDNNQILAMKAIKNMEIIR